jgi:hypothetical protein
MINKIYLSNVYIIYPEHYVRNSGEYKFSKCIASKELLDNSRFLVELKK